MHSFHLVLSLMMANPLAHLPSFSSTSGTGTRRRLPSPPPIKDTQCGFKLFTRNTARVLFPLSHIDRWIFDVELLMLAEMANTRTMSQVDAWSDSDTLPLPVCEVAVEWKEVEGSKIDLLKDSIGMALDLLVIRLNYAMGRWDGPRAIPVNREK